MNDLGGIAAVISAITGLVTAVGVIVVALVQKRQAIEQKEHGHKLEVVHKLVNSGMGEQLRIGMVSARALAELTNSKHDITMAEAAESKYLEHEETQKNADKL